jgi:hypothetical protein
MLKLYFSSADVSVDHQRKHIRNIAIYDVKLLPDFLGRLMFTGSNKNLVEANEVLDRFISLLRPDTTHLTVENAVMRVCLYKTDFIPETEIDWELGQRPEMPFHEILHTTTDLVRAMSYNSPSAADIYRNLQVLFEKHSELPRKNS